MLFLNSFFDSQTAFHSRIYAFYSQNLHGSLLSVYQKAPFGLLILQLTTEKQIYIYEKFN